MELAGPSVHMHAHPIPQPIQFRTCPHGAACGRSVSWCFAQYTSGASHSIVRPVATLRSCPQCYDGWGQGGGGGMDGGWWEGTST